MKHIYKISFGFLIGALVLSFQNCAENIDYSQYGSSSLGSSAEGVSASILNMPANQSYKVGDNLVIQAEVEGTNVQLQWYKGTTKLTGKTSNILTISNLSLSDAGTYKLEAKTTEPAANHTRNTLVSVSEAATPTPTPGPSLPAAPKITSQPNHVQMSTINGSTFFRIDGEQTYYDATFTVTATGTGLKYQWYRKTNGSNSFSSISGATSRIYTFNPTSTTQSGLYRVVITDQYDRQVTSTDASLIIEIINIGLPYYKDPLYNDREVF